MAKFNIYNIKGEHKCTVDSLVYNGKWMGESSVSVTFKSPVPISFELGDYIDYRDVRYVLNYEPAVIKNASRGSVGNAFEYNEIKFNGPNDDLVRCRFLDFVVDDGGYTGNNAQFYSNSPKFSFYCEDIRTLAERIQVNLNRLYDNWEVRISDVEFEAAHNVTIEVSNINVWEALGFVSTKFKTSFIVRQYVENGRRKNLILIGESLVVEDYHLEYGKGKGLLKVEKNTDSSQLIINRLRAYGSTKNLPYRYYTDIYDPWYKFDLLNGTDLSYTSVQIHYQSGNIWWPISKDTGAYSYRFNTKPMMLEQFKDRQYIYVAYTLLDGITEARPATIIVDEVNDTAIMFVASYSTDDKILLKASPNSLLVVGGIPKARMKFDKDCWVQRQPLSPNNMSILNLMLPSFLDYIGVLDGEEYIIPKNEVTVKYREDEDGTSQIVGYKWDGFDYDCVYVYEKDGSHALDASNKWLVRLNYDPYIEDAESIAKFGVREGCVYFEDEDEASETPEIFPTIQGITAEDARKASYGISLKDGDNGNLDEVFLGTDEGQYKIEDNGLPNDESEDKEDKDKDLSFYIEIKDIGFDIKDYLSEENAVLRTTTGMCAGYEFELVNSNANPKKIQHDGYFTWRIWLKRTFDDTLGIYFPYNDAPIKPEDKFILLGIDLPTMYVDIAAQRLKNAAEEYLVKNSVTKPSYLPTLDKVQMARDYDQNGANSLHYRLMEGSILRFSDGDIGVNVDGVDKTLYIDSLTIRESPDKLPEYEIKLTEEKEYSTIQKMQNDIAVIKAGGYSGISAAQARSLAINIGDARYISKRSDDTAEGVITFNSAPRFKEGHASTDYEYGVQGAATYKGHGGWHTETDYLTVRKKMSVKEVEIQEEKHIGGSQILSATRCKSHIVAKSSDNTYYRVYWLKDDGDGNTTTNDWVIGDQAYVMTFNLETNSDGTAGNRYYWRVVIGVGSEEDYHYIDLSNEINLSNPAFNGVSNKKGYDEGSSEPVEGDDIVQLGNRLGIDGRTSAIELAGAGTDSPYIRQYEGITSFTLGDVDTQIKPGANKFKGKLEVTDGSSGIGAFSDLPDEVNRAVKIGGENLLRNTGFDGDYSSQKMEEFGEISETDLVYGQRLEFWEVKDKVTVVSVECSESVSGYACELKKAADWLKQPVYLIKDEFYVLSFMCKGLIDVYALGNQSSKTYGDTEETTECRVDIIGDGVQQFVHFIALTANAKLWNVKLERGRVKTDWCPAREDNDEMTGEFKDLWYLQHAFKGKTEILGGLILSSLIQLGKYQNGEMKSVTAGVSGLVEDYNTDVAFWGGGTMKQAINAVNAYKYDAGYQPTEEELADMAKAVITHGGRAILNDIVLRGYIYALGGVFKGRIEAKEGYFLGNTRNVMVDITPENIHEYALSGDGTEGNQYYLDFDKTGFCFRFSGRFDMSNVYIQLPYMTPFYPSMMSAERDDLRATHFNRILIFNNSDNVLFRVGVGVTQPDGNGQSYVVDFGEMFEASAKLVYSYKDVLGNYTIGEGLEWTVKRHTKELEPESAQPISMKIYAYGSVAIDGTISYTSYDSSAVSCQKQNEVGYYIVTFNSSWFKKADDYIVLLTGVGFAESHNSPIKATLIEKTYNSFKVCTSDDDTPNNGAFEFTIIKKQ